MFFKILMNYIFGYISISVEGYFIERFINICISKKILLWNLKRTKSTFLYANVGIKDFKKMRKIASITKCRIKLKKKKGLPFIMNKYRKRKIFFILLIVLISFIFGISNFVWNIQIEGNYNIVTEDIMLNLEENGLKIGTLKPKINTQKIIQNIRLKRNDIAWIGIELKGTNAIVKIVEADKKPEINVQNGTAVVKIGDIVKEGDVLVNGWLEGKYTGTRYVHAKAEIEAKVWYSGKKEMNLTQTKNEETGNKKSSYGIKINNFKINFPKGVSNFEKYDTINETKKLKIFSNFYFPIEFTKTTYKELKGSTITYTIDEAKEILLKELENEIKSKIQKTENIVNTQVNFKEKGEALEVELIYEVLENIGTNEKILF